jgi:cytochrome b561
MRPPIIVRGMNTPVRYGTVAIALHWVIAVLLVFSVSTGLVTASADDATSTQAGLRFHQSYGLVIFALAVVRAVWRLTHPAPPLPAGMTPFQRIAAYVTHTTLYLILLLMPVLGYTALAARGRTVSLAGLVDLPNVLPLSFSLAANALDIHRKGQYMLYLLLVLHIGAALYHHFALKDGLLARMWPRRAKHAT